MAAPIKPYKDELFCRLAGILEICSDKQGTDCEDCSRYIGCEKWWDKICYRASECRLTDQDFEYYKTTLVPILDN